MPERTFDKRWMIGNRLVRIEKRAASGYMGRFGGGWQWKIGAQWTTGDDVIFNLLVMSVRIRKVVRDAEDR